MTDRELLELAAKAAGMVVLQRPWNDDDGWFFCAHQGQPAMHFRKCDDRNHYTKPWMPLTDDGEALRLAVRLATTARVICLSIGGAQSACEFLFADNKGDPESATRRAIVGAAAAIGKAMP